jgi:hypothetical protein
VRRGRRTGTGARGNHRQFHLRRATRVDAFHAIAHHLVAPLLVRAHTPARALARTHTWEQEPARALGG